MKWKGFGRKQVWLNCLEGPSEIMMKNLSQDRQFPS
jgi:hypothetical protein